MLSDVRNLPRELVVSNLGLKTNSFEEIAEKLPQDLTQMMKIKGMTVTKFEIFGTQFLRGRP